MKEEYKDKTKEQLINELVGLRQRITELEVSENERKRAKEERNKLLKAIETTKEAINITTPDTVMIYTNDAMDELFGYKKGELIGKHVSILNAGPAQEAKEVPKPIVDAIKKKGVWEGEIHNKRKDGTEFTSLAKITALTDKNGKIINYISTQHDITERKRADEKLRESEQRFRAIFEGAEDAIFTKDRKGNYTHVNPACASMFKLPPEGMIGKTDFDLFSPEVAHHIKEEIDRKVLENGEVVSVEDTKPTAGVMRTFHVVKVPLRDANGAIVGLCGIARDITERKRMEEVLQALETEKKSILNAISDVVVFQDKSLSIQWVNEAAARSVGKTPQEVVGCHCYKLWHGRSEPCEECPVLKALKTGSHANGIRKTPDGRWWEVVGEPVWDGGGNIVGAIEIARDITERRRSEEEVNKSRKFLDTIIENIPDPIYIKDRQFRFVEVNKAFCRTHKVTKDKGEILGEPRYRETDEEVFKTGKKFENPEQHYTDAEGNQHWIHLKKVPLTGESGNITHVLTISHDVTERKRAEEERGRLLQELRDKNTELERFTYTVSHDLRSPLITVQGFVEMLREDLGRDEKEKVKSDLKFIESSATKMDRLLTDTLRISRIGRMVNPPEDVPFGEIVQEALQQTTEQIKSSGFEISVVEDFPTVHVDRMRIVEVLVNLVTNSINYMGEQPRPKIDIGYRTDDGETVFFVQDNGIGIDKSQHEKVFELFYTVDKSDKGTGAGLAIVKRIIEVHNGKVWIESEKGKGCTVCFTLPLYNYEHEQ